MGLRFWGKKAFMLTLMALIISSFMVFLFSSRLMNAPDYKMELVEDRITLANYYVDNAFDYAESAATVSGYLALAGVVDDMASTRAYNSEFDSQYVSCVAYANLTSSKTCPNMQGKNFVYLMDNLTESSAVELKLSSRYIINNMTVSQGEDPFALDLTINMTLYVSDAFANITTTRVFTSRVPIAGIKDPVFAVNGTYNKTIRRTNITKQEGTWSVPDLEQLYLNQEYRYSSSAPSFIYRVKGNFSNSSLGIESMINHTQPSLVALINQNISMVDYLFWNRTNFDCDEKEVVEIEAAAIPNIPSSPPFQLDDAHRVVFNISSSDTSSTC
jgi:hypothetical protein